MLGIRQLLVRISDVLLSLIVLLLGLRFTLKLISASPATPVVNWIYGLSEALTYPFSGLIQNTTLGNGAVIDLVALVSLVAYLLIGYLIISVIRTLLRPLATTRRENYVREYPSV